MVLTGIWITVGLLLVAAAILHYLAPGTPALPGNPLGTLIASTEQRDVVRTWIRPILLGLVTLLAGQLLTLGGCNTTPTQTRLAHLEERMTHVEEQTSPGVLDQRYEPRNEIVGHQADIARTQDQRDKRIDQQQQQINELTSALLQKAR